MQGVSICQVDTTHYSIQCSYLSGSDVMSGCVYILVSVEEGVENVTGFINEDDSGEVIIDDIHDFNELIAFDWDGDDNATGNLLIIGTTDTIQMCVVEGKNIGYQLFNILKVKKPSISHQLFKY